MGGRFLFVFFLFSFVASRLFAAAVAVIAGHEALPAGERRFASALANHVERWYRLSGVEAHVTDDRDLTRSLAGKRVAVLVYLSAPTSQQLAALSAFLRRGGRLIVCYSSSPTLASMMGFRAMGYQKGSTAGDWSSMRFVEGRPRGVPLQVAQSSKNLFVVRPESAQASVLAWWFDRAGRQTAQPAWVISPQGAWMSHVLLADGDSDAKGRLLVALAAHYDPSVWRQAAGTALRNAEKIRSRVGVAMNHPGRSAAQAWRDLSGFSARAAELLAQRKYAEAWNAAREIRTRSFEVYGLLQQPRRGEIRAVWDHSGQGLYPGRWDLTCQLLKNAGISDLVVNVAGAGFAHYASNVLPRSRVFEEQGDQLKACVRAARRCGLRVHPWLLCFSTEGATSERIAIFRRKKWLLNPESARPWLDPSVLEVRTYLLAAVRELGTMYDVDGVHLDFVRYPDFVSCLNDTVRKRFEIGASCRVVSWPEDVRSGALRRSFIQWRAKMVSDFIHSSRRVLNRATTGKMLTTAVYGKYPSCLDAVGQDWESWLNIGLVDYVTPMNYTPDTDRFAEWVASQTRTRRQAARILPGIGVTAAESRLDAMQVVDQIRVLRKAGCPGFALFDLDTVLRQEILPVLRMRMTAP